jgi:hypothetical protein
MLGVISVTPTSTVETLTARIIQQSFDHTSSTCGIGTESFAVTAGAVGSLTWAHMSAPYSYCRGSRCCGII